MADERYIPYKITTIMKNITYFPFYNLLSKRDLILQLIIRETSKRYKGTYLGILWSLLTPLLMLATYTVVFSFILQTPKGVPVKSDPGLPYFAFSIFSGLIPFYVFSEILVGSPNCILAVPNYVKKVVFPLEILPVVLLGSSIIHSMISVVVLIIGVAISLGTFSSTLYMLPLAYVPLIFLCLGTGWLLASLGVYIRDIDKVADVGSQIIFFLCPIVYSELVIPESYRWFLNFNPIAVVISDFRSILLWNHGIYWIPWIRWTVLLVVYAWICYIWFLKTKKGFANVM